MNVRFFSAGPSNTISFSLSVKSRNGTSVRTPISRHTSVIRSHISDLHGATAPSSIVRLSSGNQHRPVHSTHNTGAAAGLAGSLAVKSQLPPRKAHKIPRRTPDKRVVLCGNCQCRRYIMTIWTAVTGQTGIHQPQAVQQLGSRTKSASDSRHAGTLMHRQCRRYI